MIKRVFILLILSRIAIQGLNAQQNPQYTQYTYSMNVVNPAYAGSDEYFKMNFTHRSQWTGINGAPRTYVMGFHTPVGSNLGIGLSLVTDRIGPVTETTFSTDFSYAIQLSENAKLAMGLKGVFNFLQADFQNGIITVNPNDPAFDFQLRRHNTNFGFGFFYYNRRFYLGASVPTILETSHYSTNNNQVSRAVEKANFFVTSGYVFDINDHIKFKPSTFMKIVAGAPLSVDLSANMLFNERFELGVSTRFNNSISGIFNVKVLDRFIIGYAYDHTLGSLRDFTQGSHEVILQFRFGNNTSKPNRFF